MSKKKDYTLSEEDAAEFRKATAEVQPLQTQVKKITTQSKNSKKAKKTHVAVDWQKIDYQQDEEKKFQIDLENPIHLHINGDSLLFYANDGLQGKLLRKLKRGQFPIEAQLDLHGLTIALALKELSDFIYQAVAEHLRCVLIIHGKGIRSLSGQATLKSVTDQWLRQHHDVLAFSSAIPKHGGHGALYVLLKRQRTADDDHEI